MPVFPADPLVTEAQYRLITEDTTSAVSAVEASLIDAIALAEQHTGRTFAEGEYTETLTVSSSGYVYPSATPIDSVSDPEAATIDGAAIYTGWAGLLWPDMTLVEPRDTPPRATLTYTGGWTAATFPTDLRNLVSQIAYDLLHPQLSTFGNLPTNASSVRVGDVAVSASSGSTLTFTSSSELRTTIRDGLRVWRKSRVLL